MVGDGHFREIMCYHLRSSNKALRGIITCIYALSCVFCFCNVKSLDHSMFDYPKSAITWLDIELSENLAGAMHLNSFVCYLKQKHIHKASVLIWLATKLDLMEYEKCNSTYR